MPSDVPTLT